MTRAADDFALIMEACEGLDAGSPGVFNSLDAFARLFTPRPLRELVAEGYADFQIYYSGKWIIAYVMNDWVVFFSDDDDCHIEKVLDNQAIPILMPQDMGVE